MKRLPAVVVALFVVGLAIWHSPQASGQTGWTSLFNGKNFDGWDKIGQSNWRIEDGAMVADKNAAAKGNSFLVSKNSYGDFQVRVEFWASDDANSGIFMRCADRNKITDKSCYEANIFDQRPDPSYGTGGIVHIAKVSKPQKAGGKWNTYEINFKGPQLTVVLNGTKTVDVKHDQFKSGPIALQHGKGVIKFRKVDIRPQ
ncbi:MAG: 3-keto-disaccharide hydrolase [Xanthobacteraceae bacterium]